MTEDEQLRSFVASRINDPTFRQWLNEVMPERPAQRARRSGRPITIGLNFAATNQQLKRLRDMARNVSEVTGEQITVKLTAKGVDEKLTALFERSFGR